MSCNKIDDLEDLAMNLFEFDEPSDRPKAPKKKKPTKTSSKTENDYIP